MSATNGVGRPNAGRRAMDWRAAFLSGDPATQWAAACSVAEAVTVHDRWVDSTALHEARSGAFDAAVEAVTADPESVIPAAIAGARRALYWERKARARLVPPVSLGSGRWRAQPRTDGDVDQFVSLAVVAEAEDGRAALAFHPPSTARFERGRSSGLAEIADRLAAAGWPWPVQPAHTLEDAVQAVLAVGRERAAACLSDLHPDLPPAVADELVLLVAGSRRRMPRPWPGVVWLIAHQGIDAALADAGTRAVIDGLLAGRRARPSLVTGATIVDAPARHLQLASAAPSRREAGAAANPSRRSDRRLAAAS